MQFLEKAVGQSQTTDFDWTNAVAFDLVYTNEEKTSFSRAFALDPSDPDTIIRLADKLYDLNDHEIRVECKGFFALGQPLIWFGRFNGNLRVWSGTSICCKSGDFYWARGMTHIGQQHELQVLFDRANVPNNLRFGSGEHVQRDTEGMGEYYFMHTHVP